MKTAEDYLTKYINRSEFATEFIKVINVMKEYAREAIKEDRKNVAKQAMDFLWQHADEQIPLDVANAIINTPQIELL